MTAGVALPFVCVECGERFPHRDDLESHWAVANHGPKKVQADAIDRARFSVLGDSAGPPLGDREPPK